MPTSQDTPSEPLQTTCPVDHTARSEQKTTRPTEKVEGRVERKADGVWQVRGFEQVRAVLRHTDTKQAGFKAELFDKLPSITNAPLLFQDGKAHQQQRAKTARFFTPKAVSSNYRQLMENLSDQLISEVTTKKRADLSQLSLKMAVKVANEVVGLTNSRLPGVAGRLEAFFKLKLAEFSWKPGVIWNLALSQYDTLLFFLLDVKPAIKARRRQPGEDVISHLLSQNYSDTEILIECVTYAAAGMITTREFISVAAWHFLEQPALRERYLIAPEEERYAMLEEILRLEPVVGHLYRRTTAPIVLENDGQPVEIGAGELIDVSLYGANQDQTVVQAEPLTVCPGREIAARQTSAAVMSFGDGTHRCPGAYIAIQESDIFLQRLLALKGLRIERQPKVGWNELVTGYEIRNFIIAVD